MKPLQLSQITLPEDCTATVRQLSQALAGGGRVQLSQARWLWEHATDQELAYLAHVMKQRYHKPHEATYLKMAIINYTNICVAKCDYCAFYRLPHQAGTYLLSFAEICTKIDALLAHGGSMVAFNGGFHPGLKLTDYAELFAKIHQHYPDLGFYEMTVAEFMFATKRSKLTYKQGAELLAAAGTQWITGGGAEVLVDSFRQRHSPGKYTVQDYYAAQEAIVAAGLGSTATMVIGFDESLDERLAHLDQLRTFQDKIRGALHSFLCWTYKPEHTAFGGKEITSHAYCRWLAVARIYLDNFVHIRTSVLTQNERALHALNYGADDFDLPTEDEVTQSAGAQISHDFKAILDYGCALGYKVRHRKPWLPRELALT